MKGAQTDFYLSEAFSPAYIAGRGGGKTWAFVTKAMTSALKNPGARGCLTQPTFQMIRSNFMPLWEEQFGDYRGHGWQYQIFTQGTPAFHFQTVIPFLGKVPLQIDIDYSRDDHRQQRPQMIGVDEGRGEHDRGARP